ncbi:FAD-binding oxidoreductase [Dehalococcoides mccartyi]|nr:FAD-binding oxidoreductase [Dehalococcoides mccartyi]
MRTTADTVIIGGGVMGASIAYHLSEMGHTNVVLLERKSLAAEGTGHSGALVRQHYSQEPLVKMAVRSVQIFEEFEERTGRANVFTQNGWIKIGSAEMRPEMERLIKRNRTLGVKADLLTIDEVEKLIPGINTDGIGSALIEHGGGYADPVATTEGFADVARSRGVEIIEGVSATGIETKAGRVSGVITSASDGNVSGNKTISTEFVVNAAGPWAPEVARWVGIDLPIKVTREQDLVVESDDAALRPEYPVSDGLDRIYWRRDRGRLLVGDGHPKESEYVDPDDFKIAHDANFELEVMARLKHRIPGFADHARVIGGYASLYDVTPDWHPILGGVDGVDGYINCNGWSGHGFKLGPSVGELIAQEIVNGNSSSIDISSLNLDRFEKGALLAGSYAGNQA